MKQTYLRNPDNILFKIFFERQQILSECSEKYMKRQKWLISEFCKEAKEKEQVKLVRNNKGMSTF